MEHRTKIGNITINQLWGWLAGRDSPPHPPAMVLLFFQLNIFICLEAFAVITTPAHLGRDSLEAPGKYPAAITMKTARRFLIRADKVSPSRGVPHDTGPSYQ